MRVPLEWLAEFVELPSERELVERLSVGGFEDVLVEGTGPDLAAIRVGLVLSREAHPGADRLSLCQVDVGAEEPAAIVCGASNVAAGQKVAVALPGAQLPDGTRIERARIRGVVSNGMICSQRELGLQGDAEGIWVLDPAARIGAPLPEAVRLGERILALGLTPNRGDAASLLGLAREVRALFGASAGALRLPALEPTERGAPASAALRVSIEAPEGCYRYAARLVRGVRVGPSPEWLARRLEAAGLRPIHNAVDVTQYAMLELGQPLHAFDLARLRGGEIRVRRARAGEELVTLDGRRRALDPADLVIADAERAVALAGVMGGADTQVTEATVDVLLESAHFDPTSVRLTARRHGIQSEASYRFERGVDRAGVERAADRAARLLCELAGGEVARGAVVALGSPPPATEEIRLEVARANRLLGTSLASAEMQALLERVGVACRESGPGVLVGRVPTYRNDLHLHQDLTEEVARIHGYEQIEATRPWGELARVAVPALWRLAERARDSLCGAGLLECVSFPFVSRAEIEALRLSPDDPRRRSLGLVNPVHEEESQLRSALLPSLLRVARQNLNRQAEGLRLFELSRVFLPRGAGELPDEPLWLAALLTEAGGSRLWGAPPPLFFQVRGIAERLLFQMGYVAWLGRGELPPYLHPGAALALAVGGVQVGALGELHPEVAASFGLDAGCAVLELDLNALSERPRREVKVREASRHPRVRRDIALLVGREQAAGDLVEAIRKAAGQDLGSVEVFDRYEGEGVPEGRVSLAFRLVFQRADRTLTDAEVSRATERVVRELAERFGSELR
jgi:phenylalanyl-tRNA synthetase beta chain